jgi:uncharacterized SAM-binding protein YcdF (DUF218 family)
MPVGERVDRASPPPGGSGNTARPAYQADAIVVLGCPPSARLARRVERGLRLYRSGAAPVLLLSGGGRGSEPEAVRMRRMAVTGGVPAAALLIEPNSRDTLGNARETAQMLRARGWRRIVLVSDRTHLPRAAALFRLAGVEVAGRCGVRAASPALAIAAALREAAAWPRSLLCALATTRQNRR